MPETLKAYSNRCRTCLEKFYFDEKPSQITNFFKLQFHSFTSVQLKDDDDTELLSKHVCEFCHGELLRFSCFKKDLIEKQQKLIDLLQMHKERNVKSSRNKKKRKITKEVFDRTETELDISQTIIKIELVEPVDEEKDQEEEDGDEEIENESTTVPSDDEKDQDYLIVPANEKQLKSFASSEIVDKGVFKCDYCLLSFKAKRGLTRHVQSHLNTTSFSWKCLETGCKFSAKSKIKLTTHKTEVHDAVKNIAKAESVKEVEANKFVCFCGKTFQHGRSLCAHKNRVHGGFKKCTFGCQNVQYIKTGHFIRHVQSRHPDHVEEVLKKFGHMAIKEGIMSPIRSMSQFFQCDLCNFRTLRKSSIRSHLERHLPYSVREKFTCKVCHKEFTRSSSLRVHGETVHEMLRKFQCPKCPNVSFKQAGHLSDHIASKHKRLNKTKTHFRCTICSKVFQKRYLMNMHMLRAHKNSRLVPGIATLPLPLKSKRIMMNGLKNQLKIDKAAMVKNYACHTPGCAHSFTARCNLLRHQKQKGHLPTDDLKRIKFVCDCGEKFFSYRGFKYHCDKTNCPIKSKTAKMSGNH